jgi:hypothetical protein
MPVILPVNATTFPPAPFPRKGMAVVQPLRGFPFVGFRLPWGGSWTFAKKWI